MSLTLRQVLALEPLRRAHPVVLCAEDELDRAVRWVHSSEIAEIAPLLKGGELLLTTGLGLATMEPSARAGYITQLAERHVSGVAFEVGRSFSDVPLEMVEAAREMKMPLIELRSVVPFIEITEEVHLQLVDALAADLRRGDQVSRLLNEALLAGAGLSGLVDATGRLLRGPVLLATAAGRVVAVAGWDSDEDPETALAHVEHRAEVIVHGKRWGDLCLRSGQGMSPSAVALVLGRAATIIGVELMHERPSDSAIERCQRDLIADLLTGRPLTRTELVVRASMAGFQPATGTRLVSLAIGFDERSGGVDTFDAALRALGESAVRTVIDGDVFAVVALRDDDSAGAFADRLRDSVQQLTKNRRPWLTTMAVGTVAPDLGMLGGGLREAQLTLRLARRLGLGRQVVTADSLVVERLLARHPDEHQLAELVDELIGPLIAHDHDRGTALVRTLATYLEHQGSVARAARVLFLRRQSLYSRLERIQALTGLDLENSEHRTSLIFVLRAYAYLNGSH